MSKLGQFAAACVAVVLGFGVQTASADAIEYVGGKNGDWSVAENWRPQQVPTSSDDVTIGATASVVAKEAIFCRDLALSGTLTLGDATARPNVSLTAAGDITLSGSAVLTVYAGRLADVSAYEATYETTAEREGAIQKALYKYANVVLAKGDIVLGDGVTVKPNNDFVTGTPVIFRANNITVDAGATIDADGAGWGWKKLASGETAPAATVTQNSHYTYSLGYGAGFSPGAGYGGLGGGSSTRKYGFELAPLMPGSPGGMYYDNRTKYPFGGGTICLQATEKLSVFGTLKTTGVRGDQICGSSGGGIWLCGGDVDYASAVKICADGMTYNNINYAAGGAGRIAVCIAYSEAQLAEMAAGILPAGEKTAISLSTVTVKGGGNSQKASLVGKDGTAFEVKSPDAFATIRMVSPGLPKLLIEGFPSDMYVRRYGVTEFEIPEWAYLATDPNGVRYAYAGFVVSNETAEVAHGGATDRPVVFSTQNGEGDYMLYLFWDNREDCVHLAVPAAYGTAQFNGETVAMPFDRWVAHGATVSLELLPAAGCTFRTWSGAYPRAHALGNPATLTVDGSLRLTALVSGCTVEGETISWNGGSGDWDDPTKWSGGKVPTLLDEVTIASGTVSAKKSFLAKTLTISGGTLQVGALGDYTPVFGAVAEDLSLEGTGKMTVQASRAATFDKTSQATFQTSLYNQANTIIIGGALSVGSGTTLTVANDPLTGVPVIFRPGSFAVAEGGVVTADGNGFGWLVKETDLTFDGTYTASWNGKTYATHGYGRGFDYQHSAGYGGANGVNDPPGSAGGPYGFPYAPVLPGSPCGLHNGNNNFPRGGGGTICVLASGAVSIEGTVRTIGIRNGQNSACSGGAIWLAGSSVTVGDAAKVSANGEGLSDANYNGAGGGRISFAVGVDMATLDALVDGTDPAVFGLTTSEIVSAQVTVAGGVDSGKTSKNGKPGTKTQVFDPNSSTTFGVTADPKEYIADGVVYGRNSVNYGTSTTLTAPDWAYNTAARTDSRYAYVGYVVSNATEEVGTGAADDQTVSVSFVKALGPYELRWKWGARETHHTITIPEETLGSVTLNGEAYLSGTVYWSPEARTDELVAIPADGCVFVCWTGDVAADDSRSPSIRMSAATAYKVAAVFRRVTAEPTVYHWKSGATGYWDDLAKWEEGNVPGAGDDVVIGAGTCTARNRFEVRSLTLTNAASLAVSGCRDVTVTGDLLMRDTAKLRVVACATDETHTWTNGATQVRVGGLFSLADATTFYPECDAYSGGAPVVTCERFELGADAKVDAVALGFGGTNAGQWVPVRNLCPDFGTGRDYTIGGGYGGRGGNSAAQGVAGWTYGLALSPIHPGAPNGMYSEGSFRRGGGLVRIHADRMRIDGKIDASGSGVSYGGSAGGGIWLTSFEPNSLQFGPSAKLFAKGGHSDYTSPNPNSKGGGGRIAVGLCLSDETMAKMIATGAYPGKAKKHVFGYEAFTNRYGAVTVNVNPGDNWSTDAKYMGTFEFVDGTLPGLMLLVK